MPLHGRDVVSIRDLSREEIISVLDDAKKMIPLAEGNRVSSLLAGKLIAMAFFEPSTRTRLSFESAVHRLGGSCLTIAEPNANSLRKDDNLYDTIRMLSSYADAIVLRHPNEGAARMAARTSDRPVINAGDGVGQHPTQTLQDLATIREQLGTLAGLTVVLLGDLKYGRAVHSLAYALARFDSEIILSSPSAFRLPEELRENLTHEGAKVREEPDLGKAIRDADVLYVTRIQKERFLDETEYRTVVGPYNVDARVLAEAKPKLIVMHPLPRTGELAPEVDQTPHAVYFRQAFLGVPVRMALLTAVLGPTKRGG